jgi:hypothetical protein
VDNIENNINALIDNVYNNNQYPHSKDFKVEEQLANEFLEKISNKCNVVAVNSRCPDCHYCFMLNITFGEGNINDQSSPNNFSSKSNMYVALSRLDKYAMIYWSFKKNSSLFSKIRNTFKPPEKSWVGIEICIRNIANELGIVVVDSALLSKIYNIKYRGSIIGYDPKPELWKLLFTEELHR